MQPSAIFFFLATVPCASVTSARIAGWVQRRTNALPSPYPRHCWFGFQRKIRTNSGDGLELVRRWLGEEGENRAWIRLGERGLRWAGESSRCEDPAPTVGMGGDSVATYASDHHLRPHGHQRERRRRITTRHAASLRPPRNGGIGFKPPYSQKGGPAPTDGWA